MYGHFVLENHSKMEKSGRYAFMDGSEREITKDIETKLELSCADDFLEIGFGSGIILKSLAGIVGSASGLDHPNCVKVFEEENPGLATLTGGDFLEVDGTILGNFDKILIYSVLHCLSSEEEVTAFVGKALALLRPGGRVLIGDLPNSSAKKRLLATRHGRDLEESWRELVEKEGGNQPQLSDQNEKLISFNDDSILKIIRFVRECGQESYLLPQASGLPFSKTREDILIIARHE